MGQPGPPSPSIRSPGRPASRPPPAASRPVPQLMRHRAAASASAASVPLRRDWERRLRHVLHPHIHRLLRPVFQPSSRSAAPSCPPPSIGFRWIRPERALSKSVHCFRPIGGRCAPVSATKAPLQPLRCQTQTRVQAPHLVETLRFDSNLGGTPLQGMCPNLLCVSTGDT